MKSYIERKSQIAQLILPERAVLVRLLAVVSLCLYQGWGQVIIWLFVATSRFNGAHLLNFGFEKVLELKDSIFKLILKPQHPNWLNYKGYIFSTLASRRKKCLLLHLILPTVTFPQSTDQKINKKTKPSLGRARTHYLQIGKPLLCLLSHKSCMRI